MPTEALATIDTDAAAPNAKRLLPVTANWLLSSYVARQLLPDQSGDFLTRAARASRLQLQALEWIIPIRCELPARLKGGKIYRTT